MGRGFEQKGDLDKLCKTLGQSVKSAEKLGREILDTNSQMYLEALLDNINNQKISWRPLNANYRQGKGILGYDTRVLIATGEYVSSIDIRQIPEKKGRLKNRVGVDPEAVHSSGVNMGMLAMVLEYGTADGRIPARSHYNQTWSIIYPRIRLNTLDMARKIWSMSR